MHDIVLGALRSHWNQNYPPQKALTLSFHGWPGSGKNFVTNIIIEHLYAAGAKSNFVHQFIGRIHFPLESKVAQYQVCFIMNYNFVVKNMVKFYFQENLQEWIKTNVSRCPQQIFVFDEVDKIPPQVLNSIKPMIDYHKYVDKVDYRKSIFIFLSNTGANIINQRLLELWHETGIKREDLKLHHFESLISKGAFNEEG